MKSTADQKIAPHVGEVFGIWSYYTALVNARSVCLILTNHVADKDLKETIEHFLSDVEEGQARELGQVMRAEGISFPTVVADYPSADERQIPPGAKFTDAEAINLMIIKIEGLLTICGTVMIQCVRDDLGMMFYRFQGQLIAQAYPIKKMMQHRGWLLMPPVYPQNLADPRTSP
jgi:hypothetical protein